MKTLNESKKEDTKECVEVLKLSNANLESDTIHFTAIAGVELLKLSANGDIFVKGKFIEKDKEIVEAMREFLSDQGYLRNA